MSRRDIYYWKCDRPAAFHGTRSRAADEGALAAPLHEELVRHFGTRTVRLSPGAGQGNHLTWQAEVDGRSMFVRVENGPERDAHLPIESYLLDRVRAVGVATPMVFGCDASRRHVPFAWQALERIAAPDLNHWFRQGCLDHERIPFEVGVAVATWQAVRPAGFGGLDWSTEAAGDCAGGSPGSALCGYQDSYAEHFHLRLDEHLAFLVERGFLDARQRADIGAAMDDHRALLDLEQGCLVHKDLALWNILGSEDRIAAFIDFDDAICGDPMDDLSLLACFHDAAFLHRARAGYQSVRPLPEQHLRRFWLHLLRNMIVKSVIRVGSGYFERDGGHFLMAPGTDGASLRAQTERRIAAALRGLRANLDFDAGLAPLPRASP